MLALLSLYSVVAHFDFSFNNACSLHQENTLYGLDPINPHCYTVKLDGSNKYPQSFFEQKYENYQNFSSESFQFLVVKLSIYFKRRVS